mmetsp:Transcript_35011/g.105732  ORF Transcript_35011/g.105732 Transcript_35011/m.105732 type:complete len:369 (+) Transcript_35011:730-1836(+)
MAQDHLVLLVAYDRLHDRRLPRFPRVVSPILFGDRVVREWQGFELLLQSLHEGAFDLLVDHEPGVRGADLPTIRQKPFHGCLYRLLDVDIVEHNEGALAPELQHDRGQTLRAACHHPATRRRGACEGYHRDVGVLGQGFSSGRSASYDVQDTFREASVLASLGQPHARQARDLGGLEDSAVSSHERRRDLAERDVQRVVPCADEADHADWVPAVADAHVGWRPAELGHRHALLPVEGLRQLAEVLALPRRAGQGHRGLAHGLADVRRLDARQVRDLVGDAAGQLPHRPRALHGRQARPRALPPRRHGGRHRRVHVRGPALGHAVQQLSCGGVVGLVPAAADGVHELAADVQLVEGPVLQDLLHSRDGG